MKVNACMTTNDSAFFGEGVCSFVRVPLRGAVCYACLQVPYLVAEEAVQKSPSSIFWQVPRFLRELPEFDVDLSE